MAGGQPNVIPELETLLRPNFGSDFAIVNYVIGNLVPFGENFRSCLLRINVKVQRFKNAPIEDLNLVAKTLPTTAASDTFKNWNDLSRLLKREAFMYRNIFSFYEQMELVSGINQKEALANILPKLYGCRLSLDAKSDLVDKHAVILLENLSPKGYYIVDKKIGLDFQHALKAVRYLAKFHALGVATRIKHPSIFKRLSSQYPHPDYNVRVVDTLIDNFMNMIKKHPHFVKYGSQIERLAPMVKGGWKTEMTTSDLWSTIIHFDFWISNIMFRKDKKGNVESVKFIDFQTHCFADVFVDLCYFLGTSLKEDVQMRKVDELLSAYYENFVGDLRSLGVDVSVYSKRKFDDRLREVARYELLHAALVLKLITSQIDLDGVEPNNLVAALMAAEGNVLYYRKLMQLFQIYEKKNWLPE